MLREPLKAVKGSNLKTEVEYKIASSGQRVVTDLDGPLQEEKYVLAERLDSVVRLSRDEYIARHIKINRRKKVGEGLFGIVYVCKEVETQERRAVKEVNKNEVFEQNPYHAYKKSMFIEAAVSFNKDILPSHESIIKVYQYYETPNYMYLVMELLRKPNVARTVKGYDCSQAGQMFYKVLGAVKHLHDHGLVHCDLSLTNICLRKNSSSVDEPVLIDTGNITLREGDDVRRRFEAYNVFSIGELHHVSPVDDDLSRLGDILESFLTGQEELDTSDREGVPPHPPKADTHPQALDLLSKLKNKEIREALTVDDLLTHSWFHNMSPIDG